VCGCAVQLHPGTIARERVALYHAWSHLADAVNARDWATATHLANTLQAWVDQEAGVGHAERLEHRRVN
jgi:hypothetical protein